MCPIFSSFDKIEDCFILVEICSNCLFTVLGTELDSCSGLVLENERLFVKLE